MPRRPIFTPRFPCPNCGKQRESSAASCARCRYPNHDRRRPPLAGRKSAPRRFQFHLRALFIAMTISCIFFAIHTRLGQTRFIEGLEAAGGLIVVLDPIIWFFYHWIRNISLDDSTRTKETAESSPFEADPAPKHD